MQINVHKVFVIVISRHTNVMMMMVLESSSLSLSFVFWFGSLMDFLFLKSTMWPWPTWPRTLLNLNFLVLLLSTLLY